MLLLKAVTLWVLVSLLSYSNKMVLSILVSNFQYIKKPGQSARLIFTFSLDVQEPVLKKHYHETRNHND